MPVNVKKFSSTFVTFAGTMKSERMSASPAVAIWRMASEEISSEKNFMVKVLEAMKENLRNRYGTFGDGYCGGMRYLDIIEGPVFIGCCLYI
jgi:glycine/serine hydroxymethyltransferase